MSVGCLIPTSFLQLYDGGETQINSFESTYLCSYVSRFYFIYSVSGDANFVMPKTQLTVGGFTQPGVTRTLIEMPGNAEKGFSHRFLWLFPNPLFEKFPSLSTVDKTFVERISKFFRQPQKQLN